MPATILSHQALVLPLKLRWPQHFSGLALCIGSMAPDLAFIGAMTDDSVFSHTIAAQLWYTAPVSALLVWLTTALLVPAILPYLRDQTQWRLHDLAALESPRGWRGWRRVALSAIVGGLSHVLVDGITHGNHSGWLVPHLPFLRTMVPHFGGPVPLYDALQCWLTIGLGFAATMMWRAIARRRLLWRWRNREPRSLPRMPRAAGERLVVLCVVAAAVGMIVGWSLHRHDTLKPLAAGMAFGAIDFVLGALVLAALTMRFSRLGRAARETAEPTPATARWVLQ